MTLRVYRVGLAEVATGPKLRVYKAGLTGTTIVTPKLRVYRVGLTGELGLVVTPVADQSGILPETMVTVTAFLDGGGTADSWVYRQISGPPVTFSGTGPTRTLTAPSVMPPTATRDVVIGVRAVKGAVTSAERTFKITPLYQTDWYYTGTGWRGQRPPEIVGVSGQFNPTFSPTF